MSLPSKELFEILVREHSRMLMIYLRAAGCSPSLIDDVWQETMIVAWRKLDTFDRTRPFGPWLRGIAANVLLAEQRASHRMALIGDEASLEYLSQQLHRIDQFPGDTLDEKLDALRDCVSRLPSQERVCIEMRFRDDMLPAAISESIGEAVETIKKRLVRAKSRLIDCMERKLQTSVSSLD
jgi:RNA polymerase sigma-70 factor (ECF subfamily)